MIPFTNEIVELRDNLGYVAFTVWRRGNKLSGEVVFYGIYSIGQLANGEPCIKATFPLPNGNATALFRLTADNAGNLELTSRGRTYGDAGFYFLVRDCRGGIWKHLIPSFRQSIKVAKDGEGRLSAVHSIALGSTPIYGIVYKIRKREARA